MTFTLVVKKSKKKNILYRWMSFSVYDPSHFSPSSIRSDKTSRGFLQLGVSTRDF